MAKSAGRKGKLGIVVGGGPAPGINGVIGAATIAAVSEGLDVVGILDGFKWLAAGDSSHTRPLTVQDVEETRFRGGSMLHTSRENPTKDPAKMKNVVAALKELGISYLVTIGGDDTAFSASTTAKEAKGQINVAHVPKTIDNDLPLPKNICTFGYQTAREVGSRLVSNLMRDARTTRRWYIVVAMGRTAGHLALGMGASSGATLTLIPEEFKGKPVSLDAYCSIMEGAIFKSHTLGRDYGVLVVAEGVAELVKDDLKENELAMVTYDEHGHWRLAEVPLALILKRMMQERAAKRGQKITLVDTNLGYELRCADPVPFDSEYTEQLGWGAVQYLLAGPDAGYPAGGALISIQEGKLKPIAFADLLNPKTGKTSVRQVNIKSDQYRCSRACMVRLEKADFEDAAQVKALAAAAKLSPADFKAKYEPITKL